MILCNVLSEESIEMDYSLFFRWQRNNVNLDNPSKFFLQTFNKYLLRPISSQGIFQMTQISCSGVEKAKDCTPKGPFMRHWRQKV